MKYVQLLRTIFRAVGRSELARNEFSNGGPGRWYTCSGSSGSALARDGRTVGFVLDVVNRESNVKSVCLFCEYMHRQCVSDSHSYLRGLTSTSAARFNQSATSLYSPYWNRGLTCNNLTYICHHSS